MMSLCIALIVYVLLNQLAQWKHVLLVVLWNREARIAVKLPGSTVRQRPGMCRVEPRRNFAIMLYGDPLEVMRGTGRFW
jgi:hypothetical protein